jgi:hypothetical protein
MNDFTFGLRADGKQLIYYRSRIAGQLVSNPDELEFTLRTLGANRVRVDTVIEAITWKDAKRIACTLIRLESA